MHIHRALTEHVHLIPFVRIVYIKLLQLQHSKLTFAIRSIHLRRRRVSRKRLEFRLRYQFFWTISTFHRFAVNVDIFL